MRIRALIVGAFVAVAVLSLPVAAGAAVESSAAVGTVAKSSGAAELKECLEKASELKGNDAIENAAKDCWSAPSLVTPEPNEIIWGGIAWLIVIVGLTKFGFPMMKKTLKNRTETIQGNLDAAEQAKQSANAELEQYRGQLADARSEANAIIEEARQQAEVVRADLVAKAEADAAELRAKAADDIRAATERATAELQASVNDLSIELAEKIIERNLDRDTQIALIESYINQVGSR